MNLISELDVYCFYNSKDQPLVSELHQSPLFVIESHLFVNQQTNYTLVTLNVHPSFRYNSNLSNQVIEAIENNEAVVSLTNEKIYTNSWSFPHIKYLGKVKKVENVTEYEPIEYYMEYDYRSIIKGTLDLNPGLNYLFSITKNAEFGKLTIHSETLEWEYKKKSKWHGEDYVELHYYDYLGGNGIVKLRFNILPQIYELKVNQEKIMEKKRNVLDYRSPRNV